MSTHSQLDRLCIDTIRTLSMDAVEKAASGHPGTPMALAPVVHVLYDRFLRFNPNNPLWFNRDRFVLSAGHASMLLYSALHLNGYDLPLSELEQFRQLHSRCPGHPEYTPGQRLTPGVETTTGPLGQGLANSVGMAIAERWLESTYNRPDHQVVDYRIFSIAGDGCLMEGISAEAASLAGHLGLSNLTWIYDSNRITIEGDTSLAYSDEVAKRFAGYGWNVLHAPDVNDLDAVESAISAAIAETTRPTLIIVNSHIAWGAPKKQDHHSAHGEPLGAEEIRGAKQAYGWDPDRSFYVPAEVEARIGTIRERGAKVEAEWQARFAEGAGSYAAAFPELAEQIRQIQAGALPEGWDAAVPTFPADAKGVASRDAGGKVLNALASRVPWLVGGSADLAPSTKTRLTFEGAGDFEKGSYGGRNLHFGIREHAMAAAVNGMALSGLRAYGSTFLVFSDYCRPSLRLSALMELPAIEVFTHDSIGVGEDGPTHQPVEHLAALRAIPNLTVIRPGDANEVAVAWKVALEIEKHTGESGPIAMILSRQALPTLDREKYASAEGVRKGAYVLADSEGEPELILLATGSELQWCVAAHEKLVEAGVRSRVVSVPSWEIFDHQSKEYRDSVLPPSCRARLAVEMASPFGWERYVGDAGKVIGVRGFGASGPLKALLPEFGFTLDHVLEEARLLLSR